MISLKRDTKRREEMQEKFLRYHPKFHIIDAVDAKEKISAELIEKYDKPCPYDKRRPLTKGEKCCAISHLLALEDFLQSGDDRCIIIEDDIIGSDGHFDEALEIAANLNDDSLLVLGGQQGLRNSSYLCGNKTKTDNMWQVTNLSKKFLLRTCCYSVDKKTAKKILKSQKQNLKRADNWLALLGKETKMYYADIFMHPKDLSSSNLERDRRINNFFSKLYADGILNTFRRNIDKSTISIIFHLKFCLKLPIARNEIIPRIPNADHQINNQTRLK